MDITLALLADAANVSQEGKLNILGAFSNINTSVVPARHPEMQLVLAMEASPAESGMTKQFEVKVLDEDGMQVGGLKGSFKLPSPAKPGSRLRMQSVLRITDAVFPKEGDYTFAILIDGDTKKEIPLSITLLKENTGSNGD